MQTTHSNHEYGGHYYETPNFDFITAQEAFHKADLLKDLITDIARDVRHNNECQDNSDNEEPVVEPVDDVSHSNVYVATFCYWCEESNLTMQCKCNWRSANSSTAFNQKETSESM